MALKEAKVPKSQRLGYGKGHHGKAGGLSPATASSHTQQNPASAKLGTIQMPISHICLHDSLNSQNFFSKERVSEEVTEATKIRKCAQTASATGAGPQPQEAWLQPSLSQLSFYLAEHDLVHKHLDNTSE